MYSQYYDMDGFWIIAQLSMKQARDAVPSDALSCSDQHWRTRNHHNIQQHAMLPLLPILPAPCRRVREVTCSITVFWTPLVQLVGLQLRGYCRSPLPGGRFGCSVAPPASPAMTALLIHTSSESIEGHYVVMYGAGGGMRSSRVCKCAIFFVLA